MDKKHKTILTISIIIVALIILWLLLRQKAPAQTQAQNINIPTNSTNAPTAQDWNWKPYQLKVPSFIINKEIIDASYPLYFPIIEITPKASCGYCEKNKMLSDYVYNQ